MDPTFLAILLLLVFATGIALLQARRRDPCLRDFDGFHVTLAEKGGDLSWGRARVFATGIEVEYVAPVLVRGGGHEERSFLFYKQQYAAMDALYRFVEGLPEEEQARRRQVIEQTVNPGVFRRLGRRLRNWLGMVRDALVQAVGVVIGAAKTRTAASAVLGSQEQGLKALSSEIIGHAGNAYDPLLERHLFDLVVVEITRDGETVSFCGRLKTYTSDFIEILDARTSEEAGLPEADYRVGDERLPAGCIAVQAGRLRVTNTDAPLLFLRDVRAGDWQRFMGVVLPAGFTADLTLPPGVSPDDLLVRLGEASRVDLVVPRTHALVRHAA